MFQKKLLFIFLSAFISQLVFAQQTITGTVKDGNDVAILGATIVVKGTTIKAVSDVDGAFTLQIQNPPPYTLSVSSVGYRTREVQVPSGRTSPVDVVLFTDDFQLSEVAVTARRRTERVQNVPISISVVGGARVENAGAFNVNRLKELVPSVQLYSSNPRNTTLNIRGLGSTFGLTNDGIDPGVGFYVDGVYFARPAATTLDFIDVERIEVLRGPQGTLFGKNTTAGAFNITTRKPSFTPEVNFEASYGNYGYIQAKSSITGPLGKKLAARVSFSGTQRDGLLYNVATEKHVNDLNNLGVRGQLLYVPSDNVSIILAGDASRQRPDGYAQVFAGVAPTQRAAYRQFEQIIADLGYDLPSRNPFDRKIDHDTPWKSGNDLGGVSLNADVKLGSGTLTSTTAWRYWNWDPSNDRDFTGLPVLSLSQATSKHQQWSQEVRYAGDFSSRLSGVFGIYAIGQRLKTDPYHVEESGAAQWRFSQNSTSPLWSTPGLLEGYGIRTYSKLTSFSGAVFGQLDWSITDRLHVLPGLRFNYDDKKVDFNRQTYGGLQTEDPDLLAIKRAVYTDQAFNVNTDNTNLSGQITVAYKASERVNAYGTFSTNYKPIGLNLGGLPTSNGEPMLDLAEIKPEYVKHYEIGIKTTPSENSTLNFAVYNTDIKDFQTQVQTAEVGVNRGYLANAEKVRVRGAELDGNLFLGHILSLYGALSYTDGKYISFKNAPVPLEETGAESAFKDISGGKLPGISKWAGSLGGQIDLPSKFLTLGGNYFLALDSYFRSSFSSSPSPSQYLNVDGYVLLNARLGFQASQGVSFFVWSRNLLDKDYFEQLLPAAGNAGHYAAVIGDPRTFGATIRYSFGRSYR
ncbi:TonB-dependent receptor [Olivibacter domesticus]|uniref:Iron complex outermembrane recepter protein n=1 Tax=Olivibacter domesticus TaxID=407022 RepID=A0A1H7H6Z2_OLID1|nr:TonB-dependent receptor [Olivibacter domesticus]SEK46193.1 iron complex outermembrane recepter protein [Olivibacter domesticus]